MLPLSVPEPAPLITQVLGESKPVMRSVPAPPATPLAAATHALTLLIEQRLIVEIAQLADRAEIIVLPPLCPLSVSPIDFTAANELISRAHRAAGEWLDTGRHHLPRPERFLSLHSHPWVRSCRHHKRDADLDPAALETAKETA